METWVGAAYVLVTVSLHPFTRLTYTFKDRLSYLTFVSRERI